MFNYFVGELVLFCNYGKSLSYEIRFVSLIMYVSLIVLVMFFLKMLKMFRIWFIVFLFYYFYEFNKLDLNFFNLKIFNERIICDFRIFDKK